ncbi:MAG: hypothetical protein KDF60_13790, partial [Calditrichaeota bacterium]|nr:hypothetical protein [Calditrichota bacterium]
MLKVIITVFITTLTLSAQLPEIQFENITAADGLVDDDMILGIYQDRQGFMWFLTLTGISRYDGYTFKNYKPIPNDSTSLPGGFVTSVYEDDNGQLWFGSHGLTRFDKSTEQFITFRHDANDSTSLAFDDVWDIKPDGERGLWIATSDGLDHFDFKTRVFTHFKHNPNDSLSLSNNSLKTLYVDRENILWAGAAGIFAYENGIMGLNRFNPETRTFKRYFHSADNECTLADNNIFSINEDQNGTLYVGTGKSMLHRYNREKDCFERLTSKSEHAPYAPPAEGFADFKHMVWSFIQDRDSIFWISSFSGGINRFDLKNDIMVHYPNEKNKELKLGNKIITKVYEDRQGIKWIGTAKAGLFKVIPSRQRFHSLAHNKELSDFLANKDVRVLYEDSENTFWIATSADIIRFDPLSGKMTSYAAIMDFPIKFVDAVYEDGSGGIWFGGSGMALIRIDLKSGRVKRYTPENSDIAAWQSININADSDTALWVSAEWDGLRQLNLKTEKFKFYRHDPDNERSLSSNSIWTTLVDQQNGFWVATKNGLNRLNRETDDFDRFFPGVSIHTILEDCNHNLWLGTIGSGLIRFNTKTNESTYYSTGQGLQSDEIYALVEDDHGYLWIGTKFGLTRFDPESYRSISFKKEDGLLSQLSVFADGVLKTKDGQLLFGGNGGITTFSPEDFKINTYPPFVAITGLSVFDKPYKEKGNLDSVITLQYNQ